MGKLAIYTPKAPPPRTHLLTDFAKRVLDAAKARTGQNESNIVEHLVRLHGGGLRPEDFPAREGEVM